MRSGELPEQRIKHLEMVQAVITRLSNSSSLVKGWAVTLVGVFLGFAVNAQQPRLGWVAILPALLFWSLDTYYLKSERLFRVFYERVRAAGPGVEPFGMNATAPEFLDTLVWQRDREAASYWRTAWRPTLRYLYGGLIVAAVLVALVGPRQARPSAEGHPQFVGQAIQGR